MSGDNDSNEKHKKAKDDEDDDISPSKVVGLIREQLMLKMKMLRN